MLRRSAPLDIDLIRESEVLAGTSWRDTQQSRLRDYFERCSASGSAVALLKHTDTAGLMTRSPHIRTARPLPGSGVMGRQC